MPVTPVRNTLDSQLLSLIQQNPLLTQREASNRLNVALGRINKSFKRCTDAGWISVETIGIRKFRYSLTPDGKAQKEHLQVQFVGETLKSYRHWRQHFVNIMLQCHHKGYKRIAIAGLGELCEIAWLTAKEQKVDVLGFLDNKAPLIDHLLGLPVYHTLKNLGKVDAIVITDMESPKESYHTLSKFFPKERIFLSL
jgi:DNA-binding Lrp family transcriptional regulator